MSIARIIEQRDITVVTCRCDDTVAAAVALLTEKRIGAMPVVDADGAVLGIFSERDVIRCLNKHGAEALSAKVEEAMTAPAITVEPDTSENQALALMTRRRFRHLPVVANGRMIDFVSIGDLVKLRIDQIESEATAMRDYLRNA